MQPAYVEVHYNLANALQELGRFESAVESYQRAVEFQPDYAEAHYNLGNVLQELRQYENAVKHYLRALALKSSVAVAQHFQQSADSKNNFYPNESTIHINLGNVFLEMGELAAAEKHFEAALRLDVDSALAHQGMACLFQRCGNNDRSLYHRNKGFGKQPVFNLKYCGRGKPVQLLVLGSALEGNLPWRFLIDRQIFHTTLITVEYFDTSLPLPAHQLILNAIGDADICQAGLEIANQLIQRSQAPILNKPRLVEHTGRLMNSKRMGILPGVVVPHISLISQAEVDSGVVWENLVNEGLTFPILLRPPGFHGGNHFVRVENKAQFNAAFKELPGESQLAIQFLDSRAEDNLFKKYRVMIINGAFYPIHMAISSNWKVHYFSSDMADNSKYRAEEAVFLNDFTSYLGAQALSALEKTSQMLQLDYCGIDFGIDQKGNVLLYEANATMLICHSDNEKDNDYKRNAIENALAATKRMFVERINLNV